GGVLGHRRPGTGGLVVRVRVHQHQSTGRVHHLVCHGSQRRSSGLLELQSCPRRYGYRVRLGSTRARAPAAGNARRSTPSSTLSVCRTQASPPPTASAASSNPPPTNRLATADQRLLPAVRVTWSVPSVAARAAPVSSQFTVASPSPRRRNAAPAGVPDSCAPVSRTVWSAVAAATRPTWSSRPPVIVRSPATLTSPAPSAAMS